MANQASISTLIKQRYLRTFQYITLPVKLYFILKEFIANGAIAIETTTQSDAGSFSLKTLIQLDADIITFISPRPSTPTHHQLIEKCQAEHNEKVNTFFQLLKAQDGAFQGLIDLVLFLGNVQPAYNALVNQTQNSIIISLVTVVGSVLCRQLISKQIIRFTLRNIYKLALKF